MPTSSTQPYRGTVPGYVPGAIAPEISATTDIQSLLNPPAMFPDTNRMAAEGGAIHGIPGSPAALSSGVRMTEEERLRHIALGNQLLTSQAGRESTLGITPIQQAELDFRQRQLDLQRQAQDFYQSRLSTPSVTYGGSLPRYGGGGGAGRVPVNPFAGVSGGSPVYSNMGSPGALGGGGGVQIGGNDLLGDFDLNSALEELGLSGDDMSQWFDVPDMSGDETYA